MLASIMQLMKAVVVVTVVGGGHCSQANHGPSSSFNDFINVNSINAATASTALSDPDVSSSSAAASTERDEDRLYQMRQRSRHHRLQSLRQQILSRLGMDQPPTVTVNAETRDRLRERLEMFPGLTQTLNQPLNTTQRRCYSASCDVPHRVNETLWRNSSHLGLRLYVPFPRDRSSGASVQSATLKLFLKRNAVRRGSRQCEDEDADSSTCRCVAGLLVSVYQFVRPLSVRRRGRVVNRRRLLDAKFVSASGNVWLSFNIESVAVDWRRKRKNFGVEVTVKDDCETEMDAKTMFVLPDCSVGREIGCREEPIENTVRFPWPAFVNYSNKFPYVDLVTTQRRQRSASSRRKRSLRHRVQRHQNVIPEMFARATV